MLFRVAVAIITAVYAGAIAIPTSNNQTSELCWKRGIELMTSGHELEGITLLDSLRVSGFAKEDFLNDYAKHVFAMCIPKQTDSTYGVLLRQPPAFDTTPAQGLSWKVTKFQNAPYPKFMYGSTFTFRKPFNLVFSGLSGYVKNQGYLQSDNSALSAHVSSALITQMDDRQDKALCAICIDLNEQRLSPYEYLSRRISGMYDSIDVRTDLSHYGALSLRCHNRGFYWGDEGTYTAYIVFDRSLAELLKKHGSDKNNKNIQLNRRIRFTVSIESGNSVQKFSEAKLQSILSFF